MINDQDIRNIHCFLCNLFGSELFSSLPEILTEDVLSKFCDEAEACSNQVIKCRENTQRTKKQITELEISIRDKQRELAGIKEKILAAEEEISAEEANIAAGRIVSADQEKQVAAFELTKHNAQSELDNKTCELEQLQRNLRDKQEKIQYLQDHLFSNQCVMEEKRKNHTALMSNLVAEDNSGLRQTEEVQSKLRNFDDFGMSNLRRHLASR